MDKRLFLLLLGLSLLLGFLQALQCYKCAYVKADGNCLGGRTICRARNEEMCMRKKYYDGRKVLFGFQGCRMKCSNMTTVRRALLVVTSCCEKRSFCNRF